MRNKVYIVSILFIVQLALLYSNGNSHHSIKNDLTIPEFSVTIGDYTIKIDESYTDSLIFLENQFDVKGELKEYGWNILGASFQDIEITYVDGFPDSWVYSIILNEPGIETIRGISVGDNVSDVFSLISILSQFDNYILEKETSIIIQKTFFWEDGNEGDNLESYEGEPSKTYSLTYSFNPETRLIEKIIINRAYSS